MSISIDLSQISGTGGLFTAIDSTPAVALATIAGNGSGGTNASNGDPLTVPNLSAGSGGAAGAPGSITLTLPQNSNIQILSGIDSSGYTSNAGLGRLAYRF
jgi:hypothetical protein